MIYKTLIALSMVALCGEFGLGCVSRRAGLSVQPELENALPQERSAIIELGMKSDVKPAATPAEVEPSTSLLPFFAIAAVESKHDPLAVGDRGRAIGVYQIHRSYWKDSRVPGKWEDCRDPAYSQRVVLAYWQRYCPDALRNGNLEVLCRVHNGGPQGHKKRQTASYWRKIQAVGAIN